MAKNPKNFLVSTADFALYYDGQLACTGTTNLNSSIEVSMQEQNVNGGKGNRLLYSYKYGRELSVTLEAANWDLKFLSCNLGKEIKVALEDCYKISECVTIKEGIGVLPVAPVGNVAVEIGDDHVMIVPTGTTIDLTANGIVNGAVNVTYKYQNTAKSIVIDAGTAPKIFTLILDAEKHNSSLGKVGSVQIEIPSYQPSGNFSINFTPDGVASTNIDGKALAVEGDTCESGSAVYAYIREFNDKTSTISVNDIAVTPAVITLSPTDTKEMSVIGLRGVMYSSVAVVNTDCTFTTGNPAIATVDVNGVITAVGAGTTNITVDYEGKKDVVEVTVA